MHLLGQISTNRLDTSAVQVCVCWGRIKLGDILPSVHCLFLGRQWSSVALKNNTYKAFAPHAVYDMDQLVKVGSGLFMAFVDHNRNGKYHQSYTLGTKKISCKLELIPKVTIERVNQIC